MSNESLIKPRQTQTKVKHDILARYLDAWGGIIANGLVQPAARNRAAGRPFDLHFVYVDCNAFAGRYRGEVTDIGSGATPTTVYGSPIIGVEALDKLEVWARGRGLEIRTNAILIEREAREYAELHRSLQMKGLSERVRETRDYLSLRHREIAVVRGDSTTMAPELVAYTQHGFTFSLYFLDPYGPTGIPLERYVDAIIRQPRHDVIINMPYQDLHKKTGYATQRDPTHAGEETARNYDAMFGHQRWRALAQRLIDDELWEDDASAEGPAINVAATPGAAELEVELVNLYRDSLRSVDPTLAVKLIGLHFPHSARTMMYLYLTTHDPDGALEMNRVLWDAGYQEQELRWRLRMAKQQQAAQASFLPGFESVGAKLERQPRPVVNVIAEHIARQLAGWTGTRKEVYAAFADEPYFASEINKALTHLKTAKLAIYDTPLKNNSIIQIRA